MATLEILEILGIRSFGPREPQKLQFINPVTLIHGPNGTGKTTVIECLRYATTGDQPPNTKGGAFLYDPKLSDESTIKAQVKLQFRCVTSEQCLVSRSQQASRKGKSVTVKTVDTALKRKTKHGGEVAVNSRCADIDSEMKFALGVSAPILQNVIFCHQEESNWPLSEGQALKKKFDDIFASTRYVKALDNISKIRKEKTQDLKVQQAELKHATSNKERAAEIQSKKEHAEKELKLAQETYNQVVEELKPIEEKIDKIMHELEAINQVTIELVKKKNTHGLLIKDAEEIKSSLKGSVFNGSKDGLEQALKQFESEMSEKTLQLQEVQARVAHDERSIQKLLDAEKQLLGTHGKCKQQQERHLANISKRDDTIRTMVRDYELSGYKNITSDLSQSHIEKFNNSIKEKEDDLMDTIKREKASFDLQDQEMQKSLDSCRQKKSELETSCKLKREQISSNKAQVRSLNFKLSDVEASSGRLDTILLELSRAEKDLAEIQLSLDLSAANSEVHKLQQQKAELDLKLRQLKEELSVANSQTKERTSLDMLTESKQDKQSQVTQLRNKIEDVVVENLGEFPQAQLKKRVDDSLNVMIESNKSASSELNQLKMELSSLEMKHSAAGEKVTSCESSIANITSKVTAECDINRFDDTLAEYANKIAATQDDRGLLHGVKKMFSRYHGMLTNADKPKSEQKCPLCKRPFSEEEEVDELANELEKTVQGLPARLESCEKELEIFQAKHEKLQHLVPQIHQLRELEKELPTHRESMFDISKEIETKKLAMSKLEGDMSMRLDDEESLKAILSDVYKLDQLTFDISQLEEKVQLQQSKISQLEVTRNVDVITEDEEEVQIKYDTVTRSVERQQKKISKHNDSVQRLRAKVNDLNADKLKIQQGVQEKQKMEEQKATLQEEVTKLQQEVEELADQLHPVEKEIESKLAEKRRIRNQRESRLEELAAQKQTLASQLDGLNKVQSDIGRYVADKKQEELSEVEEKLQKVRAKTRECEETKEMHTNEINELNKLLSEQKLRERELKDNLRYRAKVEEAAECAKDMEKINLKLGGLEPARLSEQRDELVNRQDQLVNKKVAATERKKMREEQLKALTLELNAKELKDAQAVYMKQSIALQVNKVVVTDLDKYYKALDRAIMQYHQNKMADLNRIIKDLWKETYRGHDIDYIEICSDSANDDHGEAVDISKRKTYNYRVVMVRNGTQMDMRGRCSAGQKVLASLIIRLALAETFCLSCGILALDEPTTNLDVENIESLACALADITRSRQAQRNFQLIIITHDTQFVEILGHRIGVEHYYKIGKNIDGHSELRRSNIEEIV